MLMAIFKTDLEALVWLIIITICVLLANWIISFTLRKIKRIPEKYQTFTNFLVKVFSFIIIIFFILEGFPIITEIDETYLAVLTSSISTALAFAMSGTFANLVAGITLLILSPFDVGDVIKVGGDLGVVRNLKLTRTVMETFDNVIINKSNSSILSSNITNYSINLEKVKRFSEFKKKILLEDTSSKETRESGVRTMFNTVLDQFKTQKIHNFVFIMQFPYEGFDHILEKIDEVADKYKEIFGMKPIYNIYTFEMKIHVRFRILTYDPELLFDYQPKFAKEISNHI
ncbi:MAG: mechanosensitive ion channel [Promethearchaeota archaeon]|nr:MAG: mechanosensitive ion channel [Candidatus Lokiarchaeota archaeon]